MLIDVEILKEYHDFSHGVDMNQFEKYIKQAEDKELKDFLGAPLFYDMMANKSTEVYVNLIKGETYTKTYNGNSYTVKYNGLQDLLAYYSLARIAQFYGSEFNKVGFHQPLYDESQEVTRREKSDFASNFRSLADSYQNEVIDFLEENKDSYPLYNYVKPKNTTFKAHAITSKNKYDQDYYLHKERYNRYY